MKESFNCLSRETEGDQKGGEEESDQEGSDGYFGVCLLSWVKEEEEGR